MRISKPLLFIFAASVFLAAAASTHPIVITKVLKAGDKTPLFNYNYKQESKYIEENGLRSALTVKVATKNQRKFDMNGDGYLTGQEKDLYLKRYAR